MKNFIAAFVLFASATSAAGQTKPKPKAAPSKPSASNSSAAVAANLGIEKGSVSGRTYRNRSLGFEVTFPDSWLIPGDEFEAEMKKAGFDLSLKAPTNVGPATRTKLNQALKQVTVALTAYRSTPGSADNAIVRVSFEDLKPNPQIKDAVDYFDAMRGQYRSMMLPSDFKYSETQAEQLGRWQLAYLDSSSSAGKKRLYATVRKGYAILFSLSYTKDEDLQAMRQILKDANFALR